MRIKASTDSTITQSLNNCNASSLSDLFNSLQNDVNSQCAEMEKGLQDVQNNLDQCEAQWKDDYNNIKNEVESKIVQMKSGVVDDNELQKKLIEAQNHADQIEELIKNL
jgi:hypothetical protein